MQTSLTTTYIGPIPPPELLKAYDEIEPGRAAKILEMADKQSNHRMALENKVINSDIWRSWSGLACALAIAALSICVGGYLVYLGHDIAGATIATAGLGSIVGSFIYGTRSQREERLEKARIMSGSKRR